LARRFTCTAFLLPETTTADGASPPLLANLHFGSDVGDEHTVTLKVETLLEWDEWHPEVKKYLQRTPSIELWPLMQRYVNAANQLLKTVHEAISREHADELRDFGELADRHNKLISKIREQRFAQFPKPDEAATSSNESS
jgi:hypothetical protein